MSKDIKKNKRPHEIKGIQYEGIPHLYDYMYSIEHPIVQFLDSIFIALVGLNRIPLSANEDWMWSYQVYAGMSVESQVLAMRPLSVKSDILLKLNRMSTFGSSTCNDREKMSYGSDYFGVTDDETSSFVRTEWVKSLGELGLTWTPGDLNDLRLGKNTLQAAMPIDLTEDNLRRLGVKETIEQLVPNKKDLEDLALILFGSNCD